MLFFFVIELAIVFCKQKGYLHPPVKEKEKLYFDLTKSKADRALTLGSFTITILAIFLTSLLGDKTKGYYVGTQAFLIYGLVILLISFFLQQEFSKILVGVNYIQRRIFYHWFYSIVFAILSIYISTENLSFNNNVICYILIISFSVVLFFHLFSFLSEVGAIKIRNSKITFFK